MAFSSSGGTQMAEFLVQSIMLLMMINSEVKKHHGL